MTHTPVWEFLVRSLCGSDLFSGFLFVRIHRGVIRHVPVYRELRSLVYASATAWPLIGLGTLVRWLIRNEIWYRAHFGFAFYVGGFLLFWL